MNRDLLRMRNVKKLSIKSLNQIIRYVLFFIIGLVMGYLVKSKIEKDLSNDLNNNWFWISMCLLTFLIAIYLLVLTFKYKYRISKKELEWFILFLTVYIFIRNSFENIVYENGGFDIINYGVLVFDVLLSIFCIFISSSLLRRNRHKFAKASNFFMEDNPKENEQLDETITSHEKIIEKIKYSLFMDKYNSSFSIGVIGPWGHGKSSFMNKLKSVVNEQIEKYPSIEDQHERRTTKGIKIGSQELLYFEFSPFLNHNEETVIQDFFMQLKNKLKFRSGNLSNNLTKYAKKLIQVVGENKIKSLLEFDFNPENNSVNELYVSVKETLDELNLKVIIFIDDMDRLNPKEILQVLKLIRNTSNFPNFVFVVALDKEYVINSLKVSGEFNSRNYIDKFFQLECHLPEIEWVDIQKTILTFIENNKYLKTEDKEKLKSAINSSEVLLSSYILNFRDCKRFLNQLIFEYNNIPNLYQEIELIDLLNLLLLKLRFPELYRDLLMNRERYFKIENGLVSLKPLKASNETISEDFLVKKMLAGRSVDHDFEALGNSIQPENRYSNPEIELIKETLETIFAYNKKYSPRSVKYIQNLNIVAFLRISKLDFSESEFQNLMNYYRYENSAFIEPEIPENKGDQIVSRLGFEYPKDKNTILAIVHLSFELLKFNLDWKSSRITQIEKILSKFYIEKDIFGRDNEFVKHIDTEELKKLFVIKFVDSTEIIPDIKFELISNLMDKNENNAWRFSRQELKEILINIFKQKCNSYDKLNWLPNDESVWNMYYNSKHLLSDSSVDEENNLEVKELNNLIKEFLKNKRIEYLFFNVLWPEQKTQLSFRLKPVVLNVFGSSRDFKVFIDKNYSDSLMNFPQIVEFLKLNAIVQNEKYLKFNFKKEILIEDFKNLGNPDRYQLISTQKTIELIFESTLSLDNYLFEGFENPKPKARYNFEGKNYFVFVDSEQRISAKEFFNNCINCVLTNFNDFNEKAGRKEVDFNNNIAKIYDSNNIVIFELISIQ